jgi:hypothetical protein
MPVHDWTQVPPGLFHHFHQDWSIEITRRLNKGLLPKGVSALVEQRFGAWEADVLTVEARGKPKRPGTRNGATAKTLDRPATRFVRRSSNEIYAGRANRIVVKHHLGRIVAIIEILSPGNKSSKAAVRDFVEKTLDYLKSGVHVLLVDLFPPTPRDPRGMHKLIWDEFLEEEFVFPKGKDRILASYEIGRTERTAFVEAIAVGDAVPEMPLFLATGVHVGVPLESTYCAAWDAIPDEMRTAVETGVLPEAEAEED